MENFQDRGVWIRIQIRFVLRGWIRIRSISDRIRNPDQMHLIFQCIKMILQLKWSLQLSLTHSFCVCDPPC